MSLLRSPEENYTFPKLWFLDVKYYLQGMTWFCKHNNLKATEYLALGLHKTIMDGKELTNLTRIWAIIVFIGVPNGEHS